MKGLRLLFAVLLAPLVFHAATADDATDIARAATRRGTTTTVSSTRQKTKIEESDAATLPSGTTVSRATTLPKATPVVRERDTTQTVTMRTGTSKAAEIRTISDAGKSVSVRSATNIAQRPVRDNATRTSGALSRSAITNSIAHDRPAGTSRTIGATNRHGVIRPSASSRARSATTDADSATRDSILSRNYAKCRDVFNSCMDEFCANKDSQLQRCACSARVNEFDQAKANLAAAEDKLLDFSERLLTINMDKEDALAISQATEGELAYATADTSASKRLLNEIAEKLNTSFDDSKFSNGVGAISLSLDIESAFDNVDSLAGASTTLKTGTQLYASALPVCREMAAEICTPDELSLAESGYKMLIEQDCNTVAKSYQTQTDQARTKVLESSALLDISRLSNYQNRNSDDILTCRQKMLDMLTDSTVCGENLGQCLDVTGRYIDPTTGEAFLTIELANLGNLITRPQMNQSWQTAPNNAKFVTFLEGKKKFLEPAMKNCEDISDYVWQEFIDDALAQIKLAQEQKLEEVRQSCTTLTSQCLDSAMDSITEFDSRALSVFGVAADRTVNAMCNDIITACTALIDTTNDTDWSTGVQEITSDKTYATILSTCREVGRNCIIQSCKSISGNFGLCESTTTSINRESILSRTACWNDVVKCVADAGTETINLIMQNQGRAPSTTDGHIYETLYGPNLTISNNTTSTADATDTATDIEYVYDICQAEQCGGNSGLDCATCRLAEQIWGNCETAPDKTLGGDALDGTGQHNRIITMGKDAENATLLSWFAYNTGTQNRLDSCRSTICGSGTTYYNGNCVDKNNFSSDGVLCAKDFRININDDITNNITNCCPGGKIDAFGNCCASGTLVKLSGTPSFADEKHKTVSNVNICMASTPNTINIIAAYGANDTDNYIICLGEVTIAIDEKGTSVTETGNETNNITCSGVLLHINNGIYTYYGANTPTMYYQPNKNTTCTYDGKDNKWKSGDTICSTPVNWMIKYSKTGNTQTSDSETTVPTTPQGEQTL